MAGTRPVRGGTRSARGGRQAPNPTQGSRDRPRTMYSGDQVNQSMRSTAMPGQGRNPGGKTYDRMNPHPGDSRGGATQSGYTNVGTSKNSSSWDGKNDLAFPGAHAHYRSQAGSERGSKTMSQTSGTPTSILNTGKSKFGRNTMGDSPRINTGRLDSGSGTGWDGPEQ